MWRQVVILRHYLWVLSTYENIYAAEECRQICEMQRKRDGIAGALEGRRSYSRLQTFEIDPKVDYFSFICTLPSGFPSMPSGSLTSLNGLTSFSVNEEKLPMEKIAFAIRSDEGSMMCFHPTWTQINKSIKLFFNDALHLESLLKLFLRRDALESLDARPLLVASLLLLLLPLWREAHSDTHFVESSVPLKSQGLLALWPFVWFISPLNRQNHTFLVYKSRKRRITFLKFLYFSPISGIVWGLVVVSSQRNANPLLEYFWKDISALFSGAVALLFCEHTSKH